MKNWIVLFVLCVLLKICSCQFTCDPFIDCQNGEVGDLVPDPEDCTQYYMCFLLPPEDIIPSAVPFQCPDGAYFYQENATCIDGTVPCRNICPPKNYCSTTCPMPFDGIVQVASKIDCTHLKICRNESETSLRCSEEAPYFNGTDCVEDETQCCDFCSPYCSQRNLAIQDPCNCNSYYDCPEVGRVTEDTTSIPCDAGQYFNEDSGECEVGTCSNICPACRTTDAPTTTATSTETTQLTTTPAFICTAYCEFIGAQIQNPCDCTTFYVCQDIGSVPDDETSIQCPPGQYFEEAAGKCIDGTCNNTCPYCGDSTASTIYSTEFTTGPPQTAPAFIIKKEND